MRLHIMPLVVATLALTMPTQAANADTTELLVGKTNIFCVKEPCPRRGIAVANSSRRGPADLLWAGQDLPSIDANEDDTGRVMNAWNSDQCLLIEGSMINGRLKVAKIVGACP